MATSSAEKTSAAPFVPPEHKLPVLVEAMPACKGCDLYKHATQVVPGAGSSRAHLMLVGEQPGNEEDKQGEPFVGPAGGVLRRAMDELHIKPAEVYVTNAVKHFKFVQRGKLRLHQNPRMSEINACRPWLQAEIDAVKPRVILCLGASAAKSLLGGTFSVMKQHGQILSTPYAERVMATVHPSAILRNRDEQDHERLYHWLVDDLALAYSTAMGKK
jgi:DNA polymerase